MQCTQTYKRSSATLQRTGDCRHGARVGFSMVEVQVALVLFGIALAGLGPCLVMYTKQLRNLQQRFSPQSTYYLIPASDLWARKLGAGASLANQDPVSLPPDAPSAATEYCADSIA